MAPACRQGADAGEEPDMVLGSNRELLVTDVRPERCALVEILGHGQAGEAGPDDTAALPVIETLTATVAAGERNLELRLLPPLGSEPRKALEGTLERLRQQALQQEKQAARGLWRRFFLLRDAFASLGPAAVLSVHRSQGSTFGEVFVDGDVFFPRDPVLRRQLVYVAVSRASQAVSLQASSGSSAGDRDDRLLWNRWLLEQDGGQGLPELGGAQPHPGQQGSSI
jgi:exodeoxyribonuclease-5